jgi:hypothetical protein
MKEVELTIHSVGNGKFRFYVPSIPSREVFKKRRQDVILVIDNEEYPTHTTCGPLDWDHMKKNQKKGYDLYSSDISKWIIKKELNIKGSDGKCRKIKFLILFKNNVIFLFKQK